MSTIRLTLNNKLEKVFSLLEEEYSTMNRVDIVKLGLSKLVNEIKKEDMFIELINDENIINDIKEAEEDVHKGNSTSLRNEKEVKKYLRNLN